MDYEQIIKLSPYPVNIDFVMWGDGVFSHGDEQMNYQPRITINSNVSNLKRSSVLIHELGHALHHHRKCKCCIESGFKGMYLRELHAYRYALRFALKHKMPIELRYAYEHMTCKYVINYPPQHQEAIAKIKKEKLWERVEKTLGI